MKPDPIDQRIKDFEAACRRLGMPVTVQRRAVLRAVLERDDHPTADDVYDALRERVPGISRTTVYRVLDTLANLGFLRRLQHAGDAARFDGRIHRHHHLICSRCHKVHDLEDKRLDRLRIAHLRVKGFKIEDFSVHLLGVCEACRRAESR